MKLCRGCSFGRPKLEKMHPFPVAAVVGHGTSTSQADKCLFPNQFTVRIHDFMEDFSLAFVSPFVFLYLSFFLCFKSGPLRISQKVPKATKRLQFAFSVLQQTTQRRPVEHSQSLASPRQNLRTKELDDMKRSEREKNDEKKDGTSDMFF